MENDYYLTIIMVTLEKTNKLLERIADALEASNKETKD